ncbi:MAG: hypothetical protein A2X94_16620 [Bdellovibrionales bacterium GWB1_55_8]|nr:MAG: hypothetical protein A2X94_16620 [Bdellovibrionales bacterium GWB1_55_8]
MATSIKYAELRCRTHYSFLRGASHPHELVERAAEIGLSALAIVDRDGVYGIPKAYEAARLHPELKLIVGAELTLESRRLTLLAKNRAGYGLLCRLITASHAGKPKGEASLSQEEFVGLLKRSGNEGLVAISEDAVTRNQEFYRALKELFPGRFYLPVSRFLDATDRDRLRVATQLSAELGVPLVATNDVHYHIPERRQLHDTLVSIREGMPLHCAGEVLFSNSERYLKSAKQMEKLFRELPEALENTIRIAEQCTFSPAELRYRYPSEWIPEGETAQSYLERLTWEGAARRYSSAIPENVLKQLRHELRLVNELGFADYFLTIWEIVEFAKGKNILCQGRGSAANSAVCYCLEITAIDPVRMNLLFERFISAERGEPPDIDVDFEHERREEVIQHIYEKYGRDRAGMVAAVITYRGRSAHREVGKALDVPLEKVAEDPRAQKLIEEILGFPRHLSIHSGGFTLSADPIIETVPIEPARMEGRTIVQWDKDDLATIGLLKVDILALGMLSALAKTFEMVRPREQLTIATIPPEDPKTYAMLQRADTVGVFQIESRAQMNMLHRLQPQHFYDLVIEIALVRPGPIVGQMVHPYLRRRRGLESSASPDPRLEPILGRTLGVPLFQEQVMKMAVTLADFTPGESDQLRRAIGAWRSSGTIERLGRKLMDGLLRNGLPKEFVDRVFEQIKGFAEYGFPESHSASFALIAYASSYLKCHYPAEFACALVNSQPMGFYSTHTIIEDVKRHGVRILPLDPNLSDWDCSIERKAGKSALRLGFRIVSGMGEADARNLFEERKKGPFTGLGDFLSRLDLPPRVLHALAMGEAFACFGCNQRNALWEILARRNLREPGTAEQLDFLQLMHSSEGASDSRSKMNFRSLSEFEAIQSDHRSFGLSLRGHPLAAIRKTAGRKFPPTTTTHIKRTPAGRGVRIAGLIIARQRPQTAKGVVFATLEDEEGFVDLMLHKQVVEKFSDIFLNDPFLVVSGRVERDRGAVNVIVRRVESLSNVVEGSQFRGKSRDFK